MFINFRNSILITKLLKHTFLTKKSSNDFWHFSEANDIRKWDLRTVRPFLSFLLLAVRLKLCLPKLLLHSPQLPHLLRLLMLPKNHLL